MTYRNRRLLDLSAGEPCVRCDRQNGTTIPAHYTGPRRGAYGGGMSIKVHDFIVADLCDECHVYMDRLSRDKEGRWGHSEEFQHYVLLTLARRFEKGQIVLARVRCPLRLEHTPDFCSAGYCDVCKGREALSEADVNHGEQR